MFHPHYQTEAIWLSALRQKEPQAFDILYDRYKGALYNYLLSFAQSPQEAEDWLQELMVKIWQQIDKYQPEKGRLFTWMTQVARHLAIDQRRKKNYQVHQRNDLQDFSVHEWEANLQQDHLPQEIKQAMWQLPPDKRKLIVWIYWEGYKQEEVAQHLAIPVNTVKTRLRRALQELQKIMQHER